MKKIAADDSRCLSLVAEVLRSGGVVMHATETCYGLAVDVFNEQALKKLYKVKRMDLSKPVSILVDSVEMAEEYGVFSDKAADLAKRYWPGPLSIMVLRKESLPEFLNGGSDFISLRMSSLDFCEAMVREFGGPVSTTSANISGEPQFYEPFELEGVDLIVDSGRISETSPSTIVKVCGGDVEVLRQGPILLED